MLAALDNPACQGLTRNIDAVATQCIFKAVKRQAVHVFGGQQHRQNAWAGHAFFNQLGRFIGSDRRRFAVATAVNLTYVFDDPNLHRHDFKLLADFFANHVFTTATEAGQFMFGKCVDDFDTWQVSRQRLAFTPTPDG
ncbi:hypothetical protein SAMN03159307_03420 [Pseudomonas sp. NFACC46-3]|nr:hypothetical protein SAMN03159424_02069 [Pseudomonas sp. NFACC05-1]SFL60957.1 hypothetical protein SAMN03159307_03420 [Pseudomonas sp. NFACC46-3]